MMDAGAPAIVVGGGIGGLSAAIALRRAGIQAEVHERAPELREVGAGISLWPNATRQLRRWGLLDEILRRGLLERGQRLLQKPFTATALAHEVRSILDAKKRRRSAAHSARPDE